MRGRICQVNKRRGIEVYKIFTKAVMIPLTKQRGIEKRKLEVENKKGGYKSSWPFFQENGRQKSRDAK